MSPANATERPVKLWQFILAIVGVVFLALGSRWIRVAELPKQESWLDAGGCHTPMTVLDPPADVKPAGSVVLLHGLSANRRLMMYLSEDFVSVHTRSTYRDTATAATRFRSRTRSNAPPPRSNP
jgi:hypothetical protein